jgi:transcription elongation factor GreA
MPDQIITKEGYEKMEKEIEYLSTIKRKEIADRIQKAKDMGDLSENAEYQEAKDAQAYNEGRIIELKATLKNLTIVENGASKDEVGMGSKITVKSGDKEKVYTIVSFNEVDPLEGKISNESPIGKAFLGKKKGDKVTVETPKGEMEYKILNIE